MGLLKCEKDKNNHYILEIAVSQEDFVKEIYKVYKQNISNINIPGFRKGKAPKYIVEQYYGKRIFWDQAINNLYPKAYESAAKEKKLEVVETNKLDIMSVTLEDGFIFKVECTVAPNVQISQYKDLPVTKNIRFVTDEDIDNKIKEILKSYARTTQITDRTAKIGDDVVIDFEGKIDGVSFEGGKSSNYTLRLGSGQFINGFEDQIVGHKIGEEFNINVKFPDNYYNKDLASKDVVFHILLLEIYEIELPILDDEFVKDISEFNNVNDFKEDIKKSIQTNKDLESEKEMEENLMNILLDAVNIEIPQAMIKNRVKRMKQDFIENLRHQSIKLEDYLKHVNMTELELEKSFEPDAKKNVKLNLILNKIAEIEKVQVSQNEILVKEKEIATYYNLKLDKVKEVFDKDKIIENLKINKALEIVKESAKINEVVEA